MLAICERLLNPQQFDKFYRGKQKPTPYGSQGRLRRSGSLAATSGHYKNRQRSQQKLKRDVYSQQTNPMQNV